MPEHILTERIRAAGAEGRPAVIPFLTAGFPDFKRFWIALDELDEGGADIIEVGVPFSDPVADGPVVEAASHHALAGGVTLDRLLQGLREREEKRRASGSERRGAPLVLMGYYNPFLQYGLARLAEEAARAGVRGCIVPDLPLGEDEEMRVALEAHDLALIPLVGINTGLERMQAYAQRARGFVYLVSVLGVTGMRGAFPPELEAAFGRAREAFDVPLALGFGLSSPEQASALPIRPDAVVIGSALLRLLEQGGTAAEFMRVWRGEK
jgi:tryptophan synthase alpha chain